MPDFLLELGLEEIPARMIDAAEEELGKRVGDLITREGLADSAEIERYSTPRRLAVLARNVRESQADTESVEKGPSVTVAYKDGKPNVPALKFAEKWAVDVNALERIKDAKGEYIAARVTKKGRTAEQILAEALPKEISSLYWPKNMYWREGKPERFVRPVRWMVALLGGKVVPVEFAGIRAGNKSRPHRFVDLKFVGPGALAGAAPDDSQIPGRRPPSAAADSAVVIPEPSAYAAALKDAAVFVRREERVEFIRKALDRATRMVPGARWREDKELLDTVVNLTEFPGVILGNFDPEFLSLPEEVLVTVMRDHQKYFAVEDANGKLAPHFLAVMNTDSDPEGIIRHGHERVLRARFNDARFFWDTDQKHPLRERVDWLKNVTFQKELGSYYDKTMRVQKLASQICAVLNDGEKGKIVRDGIVFKAALLAKTDLTTELVKEFTELQGVVGGLYAKAQDMDVSAEAQGAIAAAIYDQYKPESMEDSVPRTIEGAVLSIADKADSIAGMFALGLIPSGSKDPFALRRQANGIVKTIAEQGLRIRLSDILADAFASYEHLQQRQMFKTLESAQVIRKSIRDYLQGNMPRLKVPQIMNQDQLAASTAEFLRERLEFYLRDTKAFAYDVINAVLAVDADDVVDAVARAEAVAKVRPSPDFEAIGAAFKRIKNILRQASENGSYPAERVDFSILEEEEEKALASKVEPTAEAVRRLVNDRAYGLALCQIADLRPTVDKFFDKVLVMAGHPRMRSNRLALLQSLLNEFSTIADFSEIVTEKK